ncbi:PolC-type DNA polymerase III N-terminal domain-containing protein, partial [Exiguobacterium sp.]
MDTQQRMSLLLSDLELPNGIIEEYFHEAVLEKLRVNKAKATWTFEIRLPHVLPQNVYQLFTSRLTSRYQQFAEVKIILHADSRPDERMYHDYWPYVVQDLADVSSAMRTQLGRVLPEFKEQKLFIPVRSEPEAGFLKSSLCGELQLLYSAYGFPKFNCEPIVQINESKQEALRNQVKQEDMEEAKRMLELQFKREQSRDDDDGPVEIRIGKPIQDEIVPIKTIQDEERRIAIRGLVFSAESRELRSGKTIFTFKMTDYTDSLVVKMFARDETDVKILSAIKKGMWIQAAGRVEFDTFLRDLCMMIAQLSEVKMEAPADPWAGEKRVELHAHSQMSQMDAV